MRAIWNNQVIAEAERDKLIYLEGNWYFPPESVNKTYMRPSDHRTLCPWKGEASYYHIVANDKVNQNSAWFYPSPEPSAIERVRKDFSNYIAFWRGVTVE